MAAVRTAKQFLTYVNGGPFQHAVAVGLDLPDAYFDGLRDDLARQARPAVRGPGGRRLRRVPPVGHLLRDRRRAPAGLRRRPRLLPHPARALRGRGRAQLGLLRGPRAAAGTWSASPSASATRCSPRPPTASPPFAGRSRPKWSIFRPMMVRVPDHDDRVPRRSPSPRRRPIVSELARRVRTQHERITLTRNGEPEAVLLSVDDLEGLELTLEILGDTEAVREIAESLAALQSGQPGVDIATSGPASPAVVPRAVDGPRYEVRFQARCPQGDRCNACPRRWPRRSSSSAPGRSPRSLIESASGCSGRSLTAMAPAGAATASCTRSTTRPSCVEVLQVAHRRRRVPVPIETSVDLDR